MLLRLKMPKEMLTVEEENKFKKGFQTIAEETDMECFNNFEFESLEIIARVDDDKISVGDLNRMVNEGFVEVISL